MQIIKSILWLPEIYVGKFWNQEKSLRMNSKVNFIKPIWPTSHLRTSKKQDPLSRDDQDKVITNTGYC